MAPSEAEPARNVCRYHLSQHANKINHVSAHSKAVKNVSVANTFTAEGTCETLVLCVGEKLMYGRRGHPVHLVARRQKRRHSKSASVSEVGSNYVHGACALSKCT